jgi:hypothetical protein
MSRFAFPLLSHDSTSPPDRHDEGVGDELGRHLGLYRPADDTPGEQVEDGGNVEPTSAVQM